MTMLNRITSLESVRRNKDFARFPLAGIFLYSLRYIIHFPPWGQDNILSISVAVGSLAERVSPERIELAKFTFNPLI